LEGRFLGWREATKCSVWPGLQYVLRPVSHRFPNRNANGTPRAANPLARGLQSSAVFAL